MIVAKRRMPRPRQARTFDLDAVSGQAQRAWSRLPLHPLLRLAPDRGPRPRRRQAHAPQGPPPVAVVRALPGRASCPWTPATRRSALIQLEDAAIADGWSIGLDEHDHCPACAAALGLETMLTAAAQHASTEAAPAAAPPPSQRQGEGKAQMQGHDPGPLGHGRKAHL